MNEEKQKFVYTNCYEIVNKYNLFMYIFIGGRGIGKTYSMLKNTYLNGFKILYLRRTDEELKLSCNQASNPYKAINTDLKTDIRIEQGKPPRIVEYRNDEPYQEIGLCGALSTFGKFRGADFSDIDYIVFDEFINTGSVNTIKDEAGFMFNLIETVNRNRELKGENPIKIVLLSNANTLDNDILRTLQLAEVAHQLKVKNESVYIDEERGLYFELLDNKGLIEEKSKTALYRLTQGTAFYEMAINNEFTGDYFGDTKQVDFRELVPMVSYEDVTFYRHKIKPLLYVSSRKAQCPHYTKNTKKGFMRDYGFRLNMYICNGQALYQNYNIKLSARRYLSNTSI